MKWKKYTIETTTAAEDFLAGMLMELGIEGIEVEDNIPLTKEEQAELWDLIGQEDATPSLAQAD